MSSWVRQRYVLAALLFLAVINIYTMRVCLSVAIVQMVHHGGHGGNASTAVDDPERCAPRHAGRPGGTAGTAGTAPVQEQVFALPFKPRLF